MAVKIIRSTDWRLAQFGVIQKILDETIKEKVADDERIINVQIMPSEEFGNSCFWIYVIKEAPTIIIPPSAPEALPKV